MSELSPLALYSQRLGDNGLILAQRLCGWCGHAPELEIDLALANIGLDLLGQARNFLAYSAELQGTQHSEDSLAFTRSEREFHNLLLVEQPNGNFADTLVRQYLMDAWHLALFGRLIESRDPQLAAIAAKAIKEVRYHLRFSRGWLVRLGQGTDVSHAKTQRALNELWRFTHELFEADALEQQLADEGIGVNPTELEAQWCTEVDSGLHDAGLATPQETPYRSGGKRGLHSEHLGPLLAEMQSLARSHPGLQW